MANQHGFIAREGWPFLLLTLAGGIALYLAGQVVLFVLMFMLLAVLLYLFRQPPLRIPSLPLAILSPATGTISSIRTVSDPWLDQNRIKVSIRMAVTEPYAIHGPLEGKLVQPLNRPGAQAKDPKPMLAFLLKTDEGDEIIMAVQQPKPRQLLRCYIHPGERVGQGQRCGYLFFGGEVDLYLPAKSRIEAEVGQHIEAGNGIVGYLVHDQPVSATGEVDSV